MLRSIPRGRFLAVTVAALLTVQPPADGLADISGRVQAKQVEAGFRLGGESLGFRVHLVTGQAIQHETRDPAEIDRILTLLRIFSSPGRSRLFAELEGNALKSLQVSVP